jgi:hypothetical protein
MRRALTISFCILVSACTAPPIRRGEFTLLASDVAGVSMLSHDPVHGTACFNMLKESVNIPEDVFSTAVRDALSKYSGANVLVDVSFKDNGRCVDVQGLPGRL